MPVKLRLSRKGRKKAPFYHIVVADARAPRDGKFIEKIGTYNPMTKPATIEIDRNAAYDWLVKGAQPTDTVRAILRFKGVYYKKHLMRGVKKGALTLEQVDTMWQKWIDAKEASIASRKASTLAEMEAFRKMVSGEAKAKVVVADEATKEAAQAFREDSDVVEAAADVVEEAAAEVQEEVAAVETAVEEVADAAPATEEGAE
jgi:small subunit ribosomal protein S16